MPYWVAILLIVGLSILALAVFVWPLHLAHRTMPRRQAAEGEPEDLSAPLPMSVTREDDAIAEHDELTARELEEETQREGADRVATYEIVRGRAATAPAEIVTDLPRAELGEVLFHDGHFWRVDAIEPAQSPEAAGRLIVTLTTDDPKPRFSVPAAGPGVPE